MDSLDVGHGNDVWRTLTASTACAAPSAWRPRCPACMCSASLTLATLAHAAFRFIDASWSGVAVRGLWLAWAACGLMIRSDR